MALTAIFYFILFFFLRFMERYEVEVQTNAQKTVNVQPFSPNKPAWSLNSDKGSMRQKQNISRCGAIQ